MKPRRHIPLAIPPLGKVKFKETSPPALTAIQKRNQSILEMSRRGIGHNEIARLFSRSRSNICAIICRFEDERRLAERCDALFAQIRQADRLDATWPTADLIDAIRPLPVIVTRLKKHFEGLSMDEVSLRILMDMAIPENMAPDVDFSPSLLQVKGVGKKGYWSVVNRLTDCDVGNRCNQEWRERLAILARAWRISGPFPYSA